jgi:hypothetical protein
VIDAKKALDRMQELHAQYLSDELIGQLSKRERGQVLRFIYIAALAMEDFGLKQSDAERYAAVEACGVER